MYNLVLWNNILIYKKTGNNLNTCLLYNTLFEYWTSPVLGSPLFSKYAVYDGTTTKNWGLIIRTNITLFGIDFCREREREREKKLNFT